MPGHGLRGWRVGGGWVESGWRGKFGGRRGMVIEVWSCDLRMRKANNAIERWYREPLGRSVSLFPGGGFVITPATPPSPPGINHGIHVSHGISMGYMYPMEISMGYMCPIEISIGHMYPWISMDIHGVKLGPCFEHPGGHLGGHFWGQVSWVHFRGRSDHM